MGKIAVLSYVILFAFHCYAGPSDEITVHSDICWQYSMGIQLQDSSLKIDLTLRMKKTGGCPTSFLLFSRDNVISNIILDGSVPDYKRSNDTLFFKEAVKPDATLTIQYIANNLNTEKSRQLFCERQMAWYPVLYNTFATYDVRIAVPESHQVFAYYPEISRSSKNGETVYSFSCFDEDFPFLITPADMHREKVFSHDSTDLFLHYFGNARRLLAIKDGKPVYSANPAQTDSLIGVVMQRSAAALDWYNKNLWKQKIRKLHFVETDIFGLGAGLGYFIAFDRRLLNMEVIDRNAFSHELSHLWLGIHTDHFAKGKFFLGESVPEYVNLLFFKSWAGEEAFEKSIQDMIALSFYDVPFYEVTFDQVLNQRKGLPGDDELIYNKGVAFVHALQQMIGEEKLLKVVRETYSVPDHFVTLQDFENALKANDCFEEYEKLFGIKL